jgi:hypothetical protein
MADFFLDRLFDRIPSIKCCFQPLEEGSYGLFSLIENEDAKEESVDPETIEMLRKSPEYRVDYYDFGRFGYQSEHTPIYTDPLMHPKSSIIINQAIQRNRLKTVAALLHELTHYWAWYLGFEYEDGSKDFEDKLRMLDLPSSYSHKFTSKGWVADYDYTKVQRYLAMYDTGRLRSA